MSFPENDLERKVNELLDRASGFAEGPPKVTLLEEAVRLADMAGDEEFAYEVRQELIRASIFGGRSDVALVAFTWCLAKSDAEPNVYDLDELLWQYKWVAGALADFPQLPREQIDAIVADFERRLTLCGYSDYAAVTIRRKLALWMGDLPAASQANRRLMTSRRDGISDCKACVDDSTVEYLDRLGEWSLCLMAADPILKGRSKCAEVPQRTYAHILRSYFELGRAREGIAAHKKGYKQLKGNPEFLTEFGEHLSFLALTANFTRARQLLAAHLHMALESPIPRARFDFLASALFALDAMKADSNQPIKLRLDPSLPIARPDGTYPVDDLISWILPQAEDLARQFDARNGNTWFTDDLRGRRALVDRIRPEPLKSEDS